jgi:hypothetical protein
VAFRKWENDREPSCRIVSIAITRTFEGIGSSGPDVTLGRVSKWVWTSLLLAFLRNRSRRPAASW